MRLCDTEMTRVQNGPTDTSAAVTVRSIPSHEAQRHMPKIRWDLFRNLRVFSDIPVLWWELFEATSSPRKGHETL